MIDRLIRLANVCLLASCSGIAFWAGTLRVRGLDAAAYAKQRLPGINAKLDEARPGFVFLAGDSHAEFHPSSDRLCGREIVNGGISGAKAGVYRELVPRLNFRARPDAAILTIGTNHLTRKRHPLAPAEQAAFLRDVSGSSRLFAK